MNDEKTIETISNLLSDFLREFEQKLPELFQPYKYTKEDVLPAWKAAFFRESKAKDFVNSCEECYSQFISSTLPSVKEFCADAKAMIDANASKLNVLLREQFADVLRRRSSYDPDIVIGGIATVPPLTRTSLCPRMLKEMNYNSAIMRAAGLAMRKFVERAGGALAETVEHTVGTE